jgi:transcriptional regulator with XRE-family HTH domain
LYILSDRFDNGIGGFLWKVSGMNENVAVGPCIKELRTVRGLSLRALSELSGLSINAISMIERGTNSPTVSSLHSLASALAVPITAFFEQQGRGQVIHMKQHRRPMSETGGVRMENLASGLPNQQLEPFLMTLEPGVSSTKTPIAHSGEEFVYVMRGALSCEIGDQEYGLEEGDSLLFLASQKHSYHNQTSKPAQILIVFQSVTGQTLAHRHHLD